MDPADLAILQLVAKAGVIMGDQLANRAFTADPEAFIPRRHELALKRLVEKGYLEAQVKPVTNATERAALSFYMRQRDTADALGRSTKGNPEDALHQVGGVVFRKVYYVTQRTSDELNLALPVTPREPLIPHHLHTLDALLQVEKTERAKGNQPVDFQMESQLIADNFKGRVFGGPGQQILPKFPDAVLTVRRPDGTTEPINVEYVSSKYTDGMIRDKAAAFTGRVVWAVDNPETAARVERITGQEPITV